MKRYKIHAAALTICHQPSPLTEYHQWWLTWIDGYAENPQMIAFYCVVRSYCERVKSHSMNFLHSLNWIRISGANSVCVCVLCCRRWWNKSSETLFTILTAAIEGHEPGLYTRERTHSVSEWVRIENLWRAISWQSIQIDDRQWQQTSGDDCVWCVICNAV